MTGVCGNTFHLFSAAGDSITFTSVLLCAGQSITGPGRLYRLRFRAGETAGKTFVRLRAPRVAFYNTGLFVLPVETANARVQIGDVTDAGPKAPAPGLSLLAVPNPAHSGGTTLRVSSDLAGPQRVTIRDARGRPAARVRDPRNAPAGLRTVAWDGRDGRGQRVPAGWYAIMFQSGERAVHDSVVLVR